jgi:hypothetical protein
MRVARCESKQGVREQGMRVARRDNNKAMKAKNKNKNNNKNTTLNEDKKPRQ